MSVLRPSARVRIALAVFGAVMLFGWPESRATVAAEQQQAIGRAVPRDPQPPSQRRRSAARALALREASERRLDHIPGEVIVKFRDNMPTFRRQRALTALRSRPSVNDLEWHGDVALLHQPMDADVRQLAQTLAAQPEVEYAEPNYLLSIRPLEEPVPFDGEPFRPAATPNDPLYGVLQWNFSALDMPRAWDINPGASADIIVAVVDSGVTTVNQTFSARLWNGSTIQTVSVPFAISPGMSASRLRSARDFVFGQTVLDLDSHGTHVASTIAETTNDLSRTAGIAYNAVIMPVKVCTGWWDEQFDRSGDGFTGYVGDDAGGCSILDVADGIEYAARQGAKVINLSLGGPEPTSVMRDAISFAVQRGAFVAIAMGNDFEDGNPTNYPAKYAEQFQGAMSVAAVGRSMTTKAWYSSTGSHCEIAAPGGDVRANGDAGRIYQTTVRVPNIRSTSPVFNEFDTLGITGTSMATPHVAGLAALIMSQRPGITPAQVESIIRATAKDIGTPGKDDSFGYGLIQPRAALFGSGIRR